VDAAPLLVLVLQALREQRLEAVLIGNAAAALHGAPVTTLDFDFMFRDTPGNLIKLKRVAKSLRSVILRPYYPISRLYRLMDEDRGLHVDFMPVIHGVRTFESLRSRATTMRVGKEDLLAASLGDIIKSKKAAARPRDRAESKSWRPLCVKRKNKSSRCPDTPPSRRAQLAALKAEGELQLVDTIRRRLALPLEKRTHFLRRRLPGGGSCL